MLEGIVSKLAAVGANFSSDILRPRGFDHQNIYARNILYVCDDTGTKRKHPSRKQLLLDSGWSVLVQQYRTFFTCHLNNFVMSSTDVSSLRLSEDLLQL